MPRRERASRTQSIVASAKSYTKLNRKDAFGDDQRIQGGEEWQRSGWDFYDTIGEYRQAPTIMGALLSRAKLIVEERDEAGKWVRSENPFAIAALEQLYAGEEGQSEMLRQFGVHFTVAGEGWLISPPIRKIMTADADDWLVAAATEITKNAAGWRLNGKELSPDRIFIRIWRGHPRERKKADAPTRAVLPILNELLQLTKRVAAQIDSRLAGAGLLLLPSETSFPAAPARALNPGDPTAPRASVTAGDAQGLADLLFEKAQESIDDPSSAAALLPVIGEAPGEYIGNVKHITFWSELDRTAPKLREEAITRIARGMDVPPEVLLGGSSSNHWNMWLSDENNVKIHGEPTLKIITTGLSTKYLRPAIEGDVDDVSRFRIGADTSQMRLRPNRSKEALELNDRMLLSDESTLRENGFTDGDLMSDENLRRALLRKMASGSSTPELVAIANRLLGVELPEIKDNRDLAEARPTPSLQEHPTRELPEQRAIEASAVVVREAVPEALVWAAEQMVDRALQRAGNRMKAKFSIKEPPAPANRLHMTLDLTTNDADDVLKDAWDGCALADYGVDPRNLARALDMYTRSVLLTRRAPTRAGIAAALKLLLNRSAA